MCGSLLLRATATGFRCSVIDAAVMRWGAVRAGVKVEAAKESRFELKLVEHDNGTRAVRPSVYLYFLLVAALLFYPIKFTS